MDIRNTTLQRCQAFISSNFVETRQPAARTALALTISRQAFSRSHQIAEELIALLQHDEKLGNAGWALFDRDLVQRILEDHNLPKRLEKYMPEDRDHNVTGMINEILGLHPSQWELFHYTCDTILRLAKVGNVILMGRGAHVIARELPHVLHARIIAPADVRARRASTELDISYVQAVKRIKQDDAAREAYLRSHFDESLGNLQAFDLVINSGRVSVKQAAKILHTALRWH